MLPSVVALASLQIPDRLRFGPHDGIPDVLGTGFVVDTRGIVLTAGHVARQLRDLPRNPATGDHGAVAILFNKPVQVRDGLETKPLWVNVKTYSFLNEFTTAENTFYGEPIPDLAFVQLGVRDLPALEFNSQQNVIRAGESVALAGFPFGSEGFLLRLEDSPAPILMQMTPLLRHGIISGVHPFPCPNPHGFTIDVMSHGGASGAPIFGFSDPRVLGMLYAAIEGEHRLTYALPGHLLEWAARTALADGTLDFGAVPSLQEYKASGRWPSAWYEPQKV